ncbi:MAG: branched-chain amino acid ABC transporter substrate-binding protein, partial [candidate division Zixibacteria bacterium]
ALSALAYDALMLLADAINRATVMTRSGVKDALVTSHDFHGATGRISINEKRNAIKDVYILEARKDRFTFEVVISNY